MTLWELLQYVGPIALTLVTLAAVLVLVAEHKREPEITESGITETTREALRISRESMMNIANELGEMRAQNRILEAALNGRHEEIAAIHRRIEDLEHEQAEIMRRRRGTQT
jgi:predicted RNase H-like nuclease (RuvC/YqgF family)